MATQAHNCHDMTPEEFNKLRRAMQWAGFTIDKKQCVADSKGRLSGSQISCVMDTFSFVNDKMDVLQLLSEAKRIEMMSCGEAKKILDRFSFNNEKQDALKFIGKRIKKGYGEGSELFDEFNMQTKKDEPSSADKAMKEEDHYDYYYDEQREEKSDSDSDGGDWYDTGDVDDGDDGPGDDGGDDDD